MSAVTTLILLLCAAANAKFVAPTENELKHRKGKNPAIIGIVERILGVSHVQRGGKGGRTDSTLGMRIYENDKVSTVRSRAHLRLKDGTYLEMGEDSAFIVERLRFKPASRFPQIKSSNQFDESVFRFVQGIVRLNAPDIHSLEQYTVKTSNALIKVTGPADFYLVQLPDVRDLTVKVMSGKVEVMNIITNEKLTIDPGTSAYVKVSGLVAGAGRIDEEQLNFLKSRTRI